MTDQTSHPALSRRDFLKAASAGAAMATVTCLIGDVDPAFASGDLAENAWGVLIDVTRCTGCQSCALACKEANDRPNPTVEPVKLNSCLLYTSRCV